MAATILKSEEKRDEDDRRMHPKMAQRCHGLFKAHAIKSYPWGHRSAARKTAKRLGKAAQKPTKRTRRFAAPPSTPFEVPPSMSAPVQPDPGQPRRHERAEGVEDGDEAHDVIFLADGDP